MDCPLCNAIREEGRLIYQDEFVFCVVCKSPLKKGHVMILPKRHVENLSELSSLESKSLLDTISKMQKVVKKTYNEDTITHINTGIHSTQRHLHIHVLPSKRGLRQMMGMYEGIPERKDMPEEDMERMKNEILENI